MSEPHRGEVIRPTVEVHLTPDDLRAAMEADVRVGLTAEHKHLPPVYFYDDRGSRLFDEITRLPEYYPTRAERSILEAHAKDMAQRSKADTLVELGAGTCDKSRVLLEAMQASGALYRFVPLDVSETTLWESALALAQEFPGLTVTAVVADFIRHLEHLPTGGVRLFAFLGGTIGNLDPGQRRRFLMDLDCAMDPSDRFLLGTDLVKDRQRLVAAYDDAAGVTAEFNRNVLHVLNRELGADFVPERFEHVALWNEADSRIEMRLRSTVAQAVRVGDLDLEVSVEAGEELLTEISCKFTPEGLEEELVASGFVVEATWASEGDEFLMTLASPYC
jgi:L-histidine N-alpha-methyltransferase